MFLVRDSIRERESEIHNLSQDNPSLAALLAVIHFEWTIRRSIIALGCSPNVEIRKKLRSCHGLKRYKSLWRDEVSRPTRALPALPEVVKNWNGLISAFGLRHRLVHGVASCGSDYAKDRVDWALNAAADIHKICLNQGIDLEKRLPIRRQPNKTE